jgi:hypothetical protein
MFVPAKTLSQTLFELNNYVQKVRIGLVDEFFARFNGNEIHPDLPRNKANSRKSNLMMLYNLSQFTSKNDSRFKDASDMMDVVLNKSTKIHYSDSTWAALAHCIGVLDGKTVNFDLYLTVQHRKNNMYKWVIDRADGKIFSTPSCNQNESNMLYPDDHETNFMSLKRMTDEQPMNVANFMGKEFQYDKTSIFTYLVYSKRLKIDHVDNLEFIFTQIPGYIFHVNYFERERNNAGWLISKFYKATDINKFSFLKTLYGSSISKDKQDNISVASPQNAQQDSIEEIRKKKIDYKNMFYRRTDERMGQIVDYLMFIQQNDTLRSHSLYNGKIANIFVPGTKVIVKDKSKNVIMTKCIEEFCKMLINRTTICVRVDSVCLPIWDDKIDELSSDISEYSLQSDMQPFLPYAIRINKMKQKSVQKLVVEKEITEDGIEWIPKFGDMIVTIVSINDYENYD